MGDTFAPSEEGACLGRSVTSWTSGSGLSPACSRARRWRRCAPSSGSRGRPATRFSTATRTAASRRSRIAAGGRYRQANRLPPQLEAVIVRLKREYPGWGAPKIREKLRRQSTAPHLPAISTVHAVLDRHGLVHRRRRRRPARDGHRAVAADRAERALVRRLQRRVHARQSAVLLPADDHRFRQPLSADV